MRLVVVGSRRCLKRHPRPRSPQDLTEHDCLCLRLPSRGGLLSWEFKPRGKTINARVAGRPRFNSSDMIVAAALAGHGLAWVPDDAVAAHIDAGRHRLPPRRRPPATVTRSGSNQSALKPSRSTTTAHLSASLRKRAAACSGVLGMNSRPIAGILSRTSACASTAPMA